MIRLHRLPVLLSFTFIVLITAALAFAAPARALTLDQGHIDAFHVTAPNSGELVLDLKEDVTGQSVRHRAENVNIVIGEHTYTDSTSNVSGVARPTYFLPQAQASDRPWPGWDTNGVKGAGFSTIDFHLTSVSGPGTIFMWQQDTFGAASPVTTSGALWLYDGVVIRQAEPSHVHVNWGFDAPGTYTITTQASGINADGQRVNSNQATYTFTVGDGSGDGQAAAGVGGGGQAASGGEQAAGGAGAPASSGGAPGAPGGGAQPGGAPGAPSAPGAPGAPGAPDALDPASADAPFSADAPPIPGFSALAGQASQDSALRMSSRWFLVGSLLILAAGIAIFWRFRKGKDDEADAAESTEDANVEAATQQIIPEDKLS